MPMLNYLINPFISYKKNINPTFPENDFSLSFLIFS